MTKNRYLWLGLVALTSCTIFKNRQDACATRKFVVVERASSPSRTGKMPVPQSNIFIVERASSPFRTGKMPVPQSNIFIVEPTSSPFRRGKMPVPQENFLLWWNGLLARSEQARCLFHNQDLLLWNGLLARC